MSEIEVGEYIRTKDGIKKVKQITVEPAIDIGIGIMPEVIAIWVDNKYESAYDEYYTEKDIVKHSKNIIDLIEVGDYVNGNLVLDIDVEDGMICLLMPFDEENQTNFNVVWNTKKFIKTIVTKELFNSVMYKVVE